MHAHSIGAGSMQACGIFRWIAYCIYDWRLHIDGRESPHNASMWVASESPLWRLMPPAHCFKRRCQNHKWTLGNHWRVAFGVSIFGVGRNHKTLKTKHVWFHTKHVWSQTKALWYRTKRFFWPCRKCNFKKPTSCVSWASNPNARNQQLQHCILCSDVRAQRWTNSRIITLPATTTINAVGHCARLHQLYDYLSLHDVVWQTITSCDSPRNGGTPCVGHDGCTHASRRIDITKHMCYWHQTITHACFHFGMIRNNDGRHTPNTKRIKQRLDDDWTTNRGCFWTANSRSWNGFRGALVNCLNTKSWLFLVMHWLIVWTTNRGCFGWCIG